MIRFGQALTTASRGRRFTAAPAAAREAMSLRGDPDFDPLTLSGAQQTRLTHMKSLITRGTDDNRDPYHIARRDCIWWYSHDLRTNVDAQLTAFRVTGDLWFLDTIYELATLMIAELDTKYRGTHASGATEGSDTGYLMWVEREHPSIANQGTDLREDYDYATHALFARMAYAFHNNRDLTSPKSYDYGARADWMLSYLVNHFEAKLRDRHSKPTGFPIRNWPAQNDRYFGWANWHYYMGLLAGDNAYTTEAERMNGILVHADNLCSYSTATGTAYAFKRNAQWVTSGIGDYICPSTYTEFPFSDVLDMHFQGFDVWANEVHLERFGRAITQRMRDEANVVANGMSDCMAGGTTPCGWTTRTGDFTRINAFRYQNGAWGLLSPWDATGDIASINEAMRAHSETQAETDDTWDRTRVLAAQFLHEHLGGGA